MMKVMIIGESDTAKAFQARYRDRYDIDIFGRNRLDVTDSRDRESVCEQAKDYDSIVFTVGKFNGTQEEIWASNFLGPALMIGRLIELDYQGHIVAISSHAANWISWPEIPLQRLIYNTAKHSLSQFLTGLSLARTFPTFTVIEPPAFKTKMSGQKGHQLETVLDAIDQSLQKKVEKITLMRYNKHIHATGTDDE